MNPTHEELATAAALQAATELYAAWQDAERLWQDAERAVERAAKGKD